MKVLNWIKLMRPKHYVKNLLVFVPLFFDLKLFISPLLMHSICGFIVFSLLSSVIYIINDINDIENDRQHEEKRHRQLASGAVTIKEAMILIWVLSVCIFALNKTILKGRGWRLLVLYFLLNLAYSAKLKQVPLLDIVILVSGFLIRLLYGASLTNIQVSFWLCMTVMAASFYFGLGKRRNELSRNGKDAEKIRGVLKFYSVEFLDKNMYMCMCMAIVYYALWSGASETVEKIGTDLQIWTVPLVIVMAMKYSLDIECSEYADPVEVIMKDCWMFILGGIYILFMFWILYVK